jgi:hypothetical protein
LQDKTLRCIVAQFQRDEDQPMRLPAVIFAAAPLLMLGGCVSSVANAVGTVVTAPVRIASRAADMATTSQSEADQNRGRELRRREEQLGQMQREYEDEAEDCADGNDRACRQAVELRREMDALMPGIPVEDDRRGD